VTTITEAYFQHQRADFATRVGETMHGLASLQRPTALRRKPRARARGRRYGENLVALAPDSCWLPALHAAATITADTTRANRFRMIIASGPAIEPVGRRTQSRTDRQD